MDNIGIDESTLNWILFFLLCILIGLFIFIFIGVKAFALPGTFGAVINSLFPMAGGSLVSKADAKKINKNDVEYT